MPKSGYFFFASQSPNLYRDIPVLQIANRRFKERSDWHIFFADLSRRDATFLAFHAVKCISEHLRRLDTIQLTRITKKKISTVFFRRELIPEMPL